MGLWLSNVAVTARLCGHAAGGLAGLARRRPAAGHSGSGFCVPADFLGVCVASAADPACDTYVLDRLGELGVRQVRLDLAANDRGGFPERFLDLLLAKGLRVCLHPVQSREDARLMGRDPEAADRWRGFVGDLLDRYGTRAEWIEIGATCNRRSWAGYGAAGFLLAWRIAWEEARGRRLDVIGPNVTDFEPVYNAAWLGLLRRAGMPPARHTDNLFVERAGEPEVFDPKVCGRLLAGAARCDLPRKARLLQRIGAAAGVPDLVCAHTAWSLRRIGRLLEDVEEHQANYLARYLWLAAASGALARVYWGPLIGQREGLVDDGTSSYPDIPHVTYYGQVFGTPGDFRVRPAFRAFQAAARLLPGAVFRRALPAERGLHLLEFERPPDGGTGAPRRLHVAWTENGIGALASACYPSDLLAAADCLDRDGERLARPPKMFRESPVYLLWHGAGPDTAAVRGTRPPFARLRFARVPGWDFDVFEPGSGAALAGVVLAAGTPGTPDPHALGMLVDQGPPADSAAGSATILRAARNTVWTAPPAWPGGPPLVIKRFARRSPLRRLLDYGKPCKAIRSWNGAQELIRRGLPTPRPIACLYPRPGAADRHGPSVYVCEAFGDAWSARDAFTAFRSGAASFRGVPAEDLYEALSALLHKLHSRGVYFRDLSAGNLLIRRSSDATLELALIDTARVRAYRRPLGLRRRLGDLMRLCHPLHTAGRLALARQSLARSGLRFRGWMQVAFWYYDAKHGIKNALKRWRRV